MLLLGSYVFVINYIKFTYEFFSCYPTTLVSQGSVSTHCYAE